MRLTRLLVVAALLSQLVGCSWARDQFGIKPPPPRGSSAIASVPPEQLVNYLNAQAAQLRNIRYDEVTISASEGDGLRGAVTRMVYPTFRGNLAASQPHDFRMKANAGVGVDIDMGSNPEQFWAYVAVPTMPPKYVFASHTDLAEGRAQLPGKMPFDPEWVMQALGMTTFPTETRGSYRSRTETRDRTYVLSWDTETPSRMPITKEIVFNVDDNMQDPHPRVKKHIIKDKRTSKVICYAEIKSARTVQVGGTDPQPGRPVAVQYPTEVLLRWEEQKFEMTLNLDRRPAQVNQTLAPEDTNRLFQMPNIPGTRPENLAIPAGYNARKTVALRPLPGSGLLVR